MLLTKCLRDLVELSAVATDGIDHDFLLGRQASAVQQVVGQDVLAHLGVAIQLADLGSIGGAW
eukprot:2250386-Heterocapsa_arctica.AAC.1